MKKIVFCGLLLLLLCGCKKTGPEYLVSGMGFDKTSDGYRVCCEAVIINSEDTQQTVRLLKGEGATLDAAMWQIEKQCTQPLLFSHCAVLAVDEDMAKEHLRMVGDFCHSREEITLSAFFVKTPNAEKLLSVKPISSACAGYDIMGLLRENRRFDNRFFEVISSDYKANIPKVGIKNGGFEFVG